MMTYLPYVLIPLCLLVAAVAFLALASLFARPPLNLGSHEGRLAPCPSTPNCVSTQTDNPRKRMEPIPFTGDAADAWKRMRQVLAAWPRTRIVTATEEYLHAECTSRIFRFVDDVEILLDPLARVLHFRSASRAGRSDLGVNRRRMEGIRRAFQGSLPVS